MSLITAAVGAGLNVILNLLLIPKMGAQGAAIATAFSYFAVFALRAIHSKSFMPFNLKTWRLVLNTLIVLAQIFFMVLGLPYNILAQIILVATICILNANSIISVVKKVLKKFVKI